MSEVLSQSSMNDGTNVSIVQDGASLFVVTGNTRIGVSDAAAGMTVIGQLKRGTYNKEPASAAAPAATLGRRTARRRKRKTKGGLQWL